MGVVFGAFLFAIFLLFPFGAKAQEEIHNNSHQHSSAMTEEDASARSAYVGDKACLSCHKETVETYLHTSHHRTSSLPTAGSVDGKFTTGSNILKTSNPYLHYEMDKTPQGYFESAVEDVSPTKKLSHTERIDVVIGSGRKGQTYLFWKDDQLYELPVT